MTVRVSGRETMPRGRPPGSDLHDEDGEFAAAQATLFDDLDLDPRSRFIEHAARRLHVVEAGTATGDVPLVIVHGTGAFAAFLAPLIAEFPDRRVVAYDRPGFGLSDEPRTTDVDLDAAGVPVLDTVLDDLDADRVDLVGHSMGGYIGIRYALHRPDRVRTLTLPGSVPALPGTTPPRELRLMAIPVLGRLIERLQPSGEAGALEMLDVFGERGPVQDYPALVRAIAQQLADPVASASARREFTALFTARGWRPAARLDTAILAGVETPTLAIWGEHDPLGRPAGVRPAIDSIPTSRFETVHAGHIPFFAHPERCAAAISDHIGSRG